MIEIINDTSEEIPLREDDVKSILIKIFLDYQYFLESLNIIFLKDDDLLVINRQFLDHDYYTDIITFNYADNANTVEGELYISIDTVRDNAIEQGVDFPSELLRVIIHGALHIVGYNDATAEEKNNMRRFEDDYLKEYVSRETLN